MLDGTGRLQRVLLLGGTSEIGLATLRALPLAPGADVILAGRDIARLEEAVRFLPEHLNCQLEPFDALDLHAAQQLVARVFAAGDVDLVLPAFGLLGDQAAFEADPGSAGELIAVNVTAQTVLALEVARRLRRQGHGTLVLLSSIAGARGRRANYVYGSTKAAIDALAEGLRSALRGSGARVILVRPGFVVGRMTHGLAPAPFARAPEDVGAAVARALARDRVDVWVPAGLRAMSWAARLTPRPVWERLRR
jgi:decaprenylphospho-beta-D-erythro-pentofuranosid-2-ulose 2-reductase